MSAHPRDWRWIRPSALCLSMLAGLSACGQDTGPTAPNSFEKAPAAQFASVSSSTLAYWNFSSGNTLPASVSPLISAGAITVQTPPQVANLGSAVDYFGDYIYRFASGVYQPTPVEDYRYYQMTFKSTAACPAVLTGISLELQHNIVGRASEGMVLEVRDAAQNLIATQPFSIPGGFAIGDIHLTNIELPNVKLGATNTYFRIRMNQDIWGTESQYTAQLFLDEVSVMGRANCDPAVTLNVQATAQEGANVALASTATDADGDELALSWNLGDGTTGTGPMPTSHVYADNGTYNVSITATDFFGTHATASQTVTVANVAPTVAALANAQIMVGETYSAAGSFSDPGADAWTATADYGFGASALVLDGSAFQLSHSYSAAGTYNITVNVTDDDNGVGSGTATVTVLSPAGAADVLTQTVTATVPAQIAGQLLVSLDGFQQAVNSGNTTAASGKLTAFDNKLTAALKSGKVTQSTYDALADYSRRIRQSM